MPDGMPRRAALRGRIRPRVTMKSWRNGIPRNSWVCTNGVYSKMSMKSINILVYWFCPLILTHLHQKAMVTKTSPSVPAPPKSSNWREGGAGQPSSSKMGIQTINALATTHSPCPYNPQPGVEHVPRASFFSAIAFCVPLLPPAFGSTHSKLLALPSPPPLTPAHNSCNYHFSPRWAWWAGDLHKTHRT